MHVSVEYQGLLWRKSPIPTHWHVATSFEICVSSVYVVHTSYCLDICAHSSCSGWAFRTVSFHQPVLVNLCVRWPWTWYGAVCFTCSNACQPRHVRVCSLPWTWYGAVCLDCSNACQPWQFTCQTNSYVVHNILYNYYSIYNSKRTCGADSFQIPPRLRDSNDGEQIQ
jgi:hypothetical protein